MSEHFGLVEHYISRSDPKVRTTMNPLKPGIWATYCHTPTPEKRKGYFLINRIEKWQEHTRHIRTNYLVLVKKYEIFQPMISDGTLINYIKEKNKANGFQVILNTLLFSCVQDIVNILRDDSDQTPSVIKVIKALKEDTLMSELKSIHFSHEDRRILQPGGGAKPLRGIQEEKFDKKHKELLNELRWIEKDEIIERFRRIRNQVVAHQDLKKTKTGYIYKIDAYDLLIKPADISYILEKMEKIIINLCFVVRNESVNFNQIKKAIKSASKTFWER